MNQNTHVQAGYFESICHSLELNAQNQMFIQQSTQCIVFQRMKNEEQRLKFESALIQSQYIKRFVLDKSDSGEESDASST